jgi:hypothetical protein
VAKVVGSVLSPLLLLTSCITVERTPETQPSPTPVTTPTPEPQPTETAEGQLSEEECERFIALKAGRFPDPSRVRGSIKEVARTGFEWTLVLAKTYECVSDYGPITRGDEVFAVYGANLELIYARFGSRQDKRSVDNAMAAIVRFYPTSCYRQFAQKWLREADLDTSLVEPCL